MEPIVLSSKLSSSPGSTFSTESKYSDCAGNYTYGLTNQRIGDEAQEPASSLLNLTTNSLINQRIQRHFKYEIQFLGSWLPAVDASSSASLLASVGIADIAGTVRCSCDGGGVDM
jgi:hypothetical protein